MVFIHPVILRDGTVTANYTSSKYNYLRDLQRKADDDGVNLLPGESHPVLPEVKKLTTSPQADAPAVEQTPQKSTAHRFLLYGMNDILSYSGAGMDEGHTAEALPRRPPFLFAKRHGVLVAGYTDKQALVAHTATVSPSALIELRRLVGRPLKLQLIDQEQFNTLLPTATSRDPARPCR